MDRYKFYACYGVQAMEVWLNDRAKEGYILLKPVEATKKGEYTATMVREDFAGGEPSLNP